MDVTRAKEIIGLDQTIDVKLDGVPVWIDSVDTGSGSATVHVKNNPNSKKTVSVQELQEI
ncbi:H-type small acid-soluble spore protein [Gorillibacterium sp. sgz5001074]|uniref:H-type small acid-soluble spore protein n=1 Tax=Gorillibacterium sp. sgz5001074 TaxID=3446695 RepID=UPI003F663A1B